LERIKGFKLLQLTLSPSVHITFFEVLTVLPNFGSKNRNFKIYKLLWWRKERTDKEGANRTFKKKPDEFLEVA